MKTNCKQCDGSGTLSGAHLEDDGRCCDEPTQYNCDQCKCEIDEDYLSFDERFDDEHICSRCDLINGEPTERDEWADRKFPASEKR